MTGMVKMRLGYGLDGMLSPEVFEGSEGEWGDYQHRRDSVEVSEEVARRYRRAYNSFQKITSEIIKLADAQAKERESRE